jgi:hypothetical protein
MEYMIVPCSPTWGTLDPATELTMTTREGDEWDPAAWRRGTNLKRR